jgi:hypothetical protein
MQVSLALHPDFRCEAVTSIEVEAARSTEWLSLDYVVKGRIAELKIPALVGPERTDELWKHTCLEAFIRPTGTSGYCEFNFAPSGQWAAYRFDDYRAGMRNAEMPFVPIMALAVGEAEQKLGVMLPLMELGLSGVALQLGLSAVIEERSGAKSYWSLKHPKGRPDFHHSDGFAFEIPAA